jgi:hypothetical protein
LRCLDDLGADFGDGGEVEPEAGVGDDQQVDIADSSRASTARCTLPPDSPFSMARPVPASSPCRAISSARRVAHRAGLEPPAVG